VVRLVSGLLTALLVLLKLTLAIIVIASLYTMFSVFVGAMSSMDESAFSQKFNPDGSIDMIFKVNARNDGFLDSRMDITVKLLSNGVIVAEGNDSAVISPKSSRELRAVLTITRSQAMELMNTQPSLEISFKVRTFNDLIGMSLTTEVKE